MFLQTCLWLPVTRATGLDDQTFAQRLFAERNITVLPGSFLGRGEDNPGAGHVRVAWVAPLDACVEAESRKPYRESL